MPGEDLQSWSTTAATNATADTLINWAEGQPRASVNNSSRSMMAAHAKDRNLRNGSIVTGGTADAQTFTSGVTYTAVPTGLRVLLKIGAANTTACTLNMDGIGPVEIKRKTAGHPSLVAGDLILSGFCEFLYDGTNWLLLDSATSADLAGKVSKAGDTMTGTLTAPNITATANVTTPGLTLGAGGAFMQSSGANVVVSNALFADQFVQAGTGYKVRPGIFGAAGTSVFNFYWNGITLDAWVDSTDVGSILFGAPSDARIKTVVGDYEHGLAEIAALDPVRYTFRGNDTSSAPTGSVPYNNSPRHDVAVARTEFVGLIAQNVVAHLPEVVTLKTGYIDGAKVTDLHGLDTMALVYALINSIKELKRRLEALEAKP